MSPRVVALPAEDVGLPVGRLDDWCEWCRKAVADFDTHWCPKRPQQRNDEGEPSGGRRASPPGDAAGDLQASRPLRGEGAESGDLSTHTPHAQAERGAATEQDPSAAAPQGALPTRFGRSWQEHVEAWKAAGRAVEEALWVRAAVAYSCRETFGASGVEKFAAEVQQTERRVRQLADAFAAFPDPGKRFPLSFSHHQLAAATEHPGDTLAKAVEQGWTTVAKLRAALAPPPAEKAKPPAAPVAAPDLAPAEALVEQVTQTKWADLDVRAETQRMQKLVGAVKPADLDALHAIFTEGIERITDRWNDIEREKALA